MPDSSARLVLLKELKGLLQSDGEKKADLEAVLERILDHFECVVGTIHVLDAASGVLQLRAQRGIPASLAARVGRIPVGKGIAGQAAERREPVQSCNLQTDTSGGGKPAARESGMEGSIAVPILHDNAVRGVLGIASPVVHEFDAAEIALLQEVASTLGKHLVDRC